jgi:hypothetical protein
MKAVLIKDSKIKNIIEGVTSYDDVNIYGESGLIEGLNPELEIIILEDSVLVDFDRKTMQSKTAVKDILPLNIKGNEDYKKQVAELRAQRNALLAETDYLIMPDYPATKEQKEEIKAYRQALRDLPASITKENIDTIKFPEKPNLQTSVKSQ